jgi:hypothetical protein
MDFTREIPGTQAMTHCLTLPTNYNLSLLSSPFMFYFHGWGGKHEECGEFCNVLAAGKGFTSPAMTGYGKKQLRNDTCMKQYKQWKSFQMGRS